jgi:HlyD family secretion protein
VNVLSVPINAVTTRDRSDTGLVAKDEKKSSKAEPAEGAGESRPVEELEEVVFVLDAENAVRRVVVRTDIQDMNHIEILGGLKEGDQVVTGPYTVVSKLLRNGMKVKVVPKEELFEVKK